MGSGASVPVDSDANPELVNALKEEYDTIMAAEDHPSHEEVVEMVRTVNGGKAVLMI